MSRFQDLGEKLLGLLVGLSSKGRRAKNTEHNSERRQQGVGALQSFNFCCGIRT